MTLSAAACAAAVSRAAPSVCDPDVMHLIMTNHINNKHISRCVHAVFSPDLAPASRDYILSFICGWPAKHNPQLANWTTEMVAIKEQFLLSLMSYQIWWQIRTVSQICIELTNFPSTEQNPDDSCLDQVCWQDYKLYRTNQLFNTTIMKILSYLDMALFEP